MFAQLHNFKCQRDDLICSKICQAHTFLRAVVEESYFEEGDTFIVHYGVFFRGVVEPHDMSVRELRPVQEENVVDVLMHQSIWVFHVGRLVDDQLHAKNQTT